MLEGGEPGLSGWTVNLLDSSNTTIDTATTVAGGGYSFTGLLPGTYTVQVVSQPGYVASTSASVQITDNNGGADTVNFGEFVPVTVSGEVFNDLNDTGTFVSGDPGLSGWTVKLVHGGQVMQTTTASDGTYSFSNVGPGTYTLEDLLQPGYVQTTPAAGSFSITTSSGGQFSGENFGAYQAQSGPMVYMVTSSADSGDRSLREAIESADMLGRASLSISIVGPADDQVYRPPSVTILP